MLLPEPHLQAPKPTNGSTAGAQAILHYLRLDMLVPPAKMDTRLRKLKGIKKVTINYVTHTVKIRYDPNTVTLEAIRTLLKKRGSDGQNLTQFMKQSLRVEERRNRVTCVRKWSP